MPLLTMRTIDKSFFGKFANQKVNLDVEAGEVHALLGENGAGKTTLMNILYGIYTKDAGEIYYDGQPVEFRSPKEAIAHKIGMVHQHFMLVPTLTVSQNITLGLRGKGYPCSNRKQLNQKITQISSQYGLAIDPDARVNTLSVGEQQRVEIMKLLYRDARLLILDEPTAVLTPQETKNFFRVLKKLREDGRSVILITHHIPEVMDIADQVTVLRDTRSIITAPITELTEEKLSEYMIGRQLKPIERPMDTAREGTGLEVRELKMIRKGVARLNGISFCIAPGEILGIAGVDGNGQKELVEAIMGIGKTPGGSVLLYGEEIKNLPIRSRIRRGLGYISDDRQQDELLMDMNLAENMLLKMYEDKTMNRHGIIHKKSLYAKTQAAIENYDIKTYSLEIPIRLLSGGNQQKLVLARELAGEPRALVVSQPTRGLDIGASEFIREQLLAGKKNGCSILLISADLEEILALSDRIAVIHGGRIMGIVPNTGEVDMTAVGLMMAGRDSMAEREEGEDADE